MADSRSTSRLIDEGPRLATGPAARLVRSSGPVPGWAVVSAGLSPVLLTGGWLVGDAFQPASYSPIHKTVSVLAGYAGTDRWIMTSALLLVGCCNFVTAAGLTGVRLPARILLLVTGLSSIGIAASPEPVAGSTPQHLVWTSLGEVTIAVWPAFTGRRGSLRPLILSIRGAATVTAVSVSLLGWLVIETQGGSVLGLAERLTSSIQITWPFIVAVALRHVWPGRRRDNVGQVSRVHDMGGQTGFGPVPTEDDGQFFHADWEARVYAIIRMLQRRGVINAAFDDLRDAIERIPPAEYLAMSYYERWLRAAEMLLAERGLLAGD
jgi:hypothetical protein